MGDKEEGNLVGIKGYEEFDLNDPNFMRFIKRRMKNKNMTQVEAKSGGLAKRGYGKAKR